MDPRSELLISKHMSTQQKTNAKELRLLSDDALPKNDIKAIFFDIDGTLLSLDGQYSVATQAAIADVKRRGVATAIASGRPFFAAKFIADELGLDSPGVLCAGAHIVHPLQRKTIYCAEIDTATSLSLTHALRQLNIHYEIYTDEGYYVEDDHMSEIREVHAQHLRIQPVRKQFDEIISSSPIVKFLAAVHSTELHDVLLQLERDFPELIFSYANIAAHPKWLFVSMTNKQATREMAFDKLLQWHNIAPENVMSFGDAQSDCVFLQKAGVGVAMGNASEEVKQCADFVTLPVWDDGIAYALQRILL